MFLEATASVRAVAGQGIFKDRKTRCGGLEFVDVDRLPFQRLVILEESAKDVQAMSRQLVGLPEAVVLRIVRGYCQNLVILLAAVDHRHQADGTSTDERQWSDRLLAKNEHVERVVVLRQGPRAD